jgi:DNA-binding NarL/FixJ family response regulator
VTIVEDSAVFGEAIANILRDFDIEVGAIIRSAEGVLPSVAADAPDVVILDIRIPPTHTDEGIRLAEQLRPLYPDLGILVFSTFSEAAFGMRLLENVGGGFGYLTKDGVESAEFLRDAVFRVAAGGNVIAPEIIRELVREKDRRSKIPLTGRERSVLSKLAEGYSNAGIGEALGIAQKTVEAHLVTIFTKLGIPNENGVNRRVLAVLQFLRSDEGRLPR